MRIRTVLTSAAAAVMLLAPTSAAQAAAPPDRSDRDGPARRRRHHRPRHRPARGPVRLAAGTVAPATGTDGADLPTLLHDRGTGGYSLVAVLDDGRSQADFDLDLPDGAELRPAGDGAFWVVDLASERTVGAVEAPWAVDAPGTLLPTRYTLLPDGRLRQHVDTERRRRSRSRPTRPSRSGSTAASRSRTCSGTAPTRSSSPRSPAGGCRRHGDLRDAPGRLAGPGRVLGDGRSLRRRHGGHGAGRGPHPRPVLQDAGAALPGGRHDLDDVRLVPRAVLTTTEGAEPLSPSRIGAEVAVFARLPRRRTSAPASCSATACPGAVWIVLFVVAYARPHRRPPRLAAASAVRNAPLLTRSASARERPVSSRSRAVPAWSAGAAVSRGGRPPARARSRGAG